MPSKPSQKKTSAKSPKKVVSKKSSPTKKATVSTNNGSPKTSQRKITATPAQLLQAKTKTVLGRLRKKNANYLRRRPHRSFRLTHRRDYVRSLKLPGYFVFTLETAAVLWRNKLTFFLLGLTFFALFYAFNLMGTQDNYQNLHDVLYQTAPDSLFDGVSGSVEKAGLLLYASVTQNINNTPDTAQKIMATMIAVYIWLSIIWLLRNIMSGRKVKLRDGLYNAGAPIIPMCLMTITLLVQLIPVAIGVIIASAAWQSGFLEQGAWAMLAAISIALLATLTLYWITSTLIALIIVTLPGMYPMRALTIAGDLVVGRRLRLVYRFLWMLLTVASWWIVIMIPVILFDNWIKSVYTTIAWVPIVPVMLLVMSTFTLFWTATYTYLLYRKMVDDDASPA